MLLRISVARTVMLTFASPSFASDDLTSSVTLRFPSELGLRSLQPVSRRIATDRRILPYITL